MRVRVVREFSFRAAMGLLVAATLGASGWAGAAPGGGRIPDSYQALFGLFESPPAPAPGANPQGDKVDLQCPQIEVLDGTASLRVYAGGQTNKDVRYQYSLGNVVRECSLQNNQIAIKVGLDGRVLIGPKGSPGSFTAPVRIAIRRDADRTAAASKLYRVPVTVQPGATEAPFTLVTEPLLVPFTRAEADQDYTVVVGFDEKGEAPEKPGKRRKHAK